MWSGLEHHPAGHFPSAGQLIDEPVGATAGDFIKEIRNHAMVAREGDLSVIDIGIVATTEYAHTPSPALARERRGVPAAGVGEVLVVVVTAEDLQVLRHGVV